MCLHNDSVMNSLEFRQAVDLGMQRLGFQFLAEIAANEKKIIYKDNAKKSVK